MLRPAAAQAPQESGQAQASAGQDGAAAQTGLVHIVPFGRNGGTLKNTLVPVGTAHLTYWGGPVVSQVHAIAVFWGTHVDASITAGIGQFFTDITSSRHYDLLSEYSTVGVTGSGVPATSSNQLIKHGLFDGSFTITPTLCNVTPPATCSITDAQIQTELSNQIAAGHLPTPVSDAQGNVQSFYMIYFPPGVSITVGTAKSCVSGGFCAYHSNTANALYGVQPDFSGPGGCSLGCGTGATLFQNATAVTSHELSEAVTDPQVGSATTTAPPLAWYDPNGNNGEIGDICAGLDVTVTAGTNTYSVQQEFSNLQNDCISAPPVFNVTGPASVTQGSSANVTLTVQSSVNAATLTGYLGKIHFTSSDSLAVLPADYAFIAADAGTHSFTVTLNSAGSQTITATDLVATGFVGSASISVNGVPDLTVSKTHLGSFTQGQNGAYTITVSNAGQGATSGTVTAVDTLPAGLSATAIGGTGWTCTLATLTCTRSDVLAAGAAYPAITVNVTAAVNAPASVTNSVTVSGGGETNTANNTATDPTLIAAAVPDLFPVATTGPYIQGQTGATLAFTATNRGTAASSGTVTLTATLPAGLTATAVSGTGWTCTLANLTCTRADSVGPNNSYPSITLTFNIALNTPFTATGSVAVSGGGDATPSNNTIGIPFNVGQLIDLRVNVPGNATTAGQPEVYGIGVAFFPSVGGVTFACSGLPIGAACSFNPPTLTAPGGMTVTISTTARNASVPSGFRLPGGNNPQTLILVLGFAGLAALALGRRRVSRRFAVVATALLLCLVVGCGGGGQSANVSPTPNPNATPVGGYVVTLTATGTSLPASASVPLQLVVN